MIQLTLFLILDICYQDFIFKNTYIFYILYLLFKNP